MRSGGSTRATSRGGDRSIVSPDRTRYDARWRRDRCRDCWRSGIARQRSFARTEGRISCISRGSHTVSLSAFATARIAAYDWHSIHRLSPMTRSRFLSAALAASLFSGPALLAAQGPSPLPRELAARIDALASKTVAWRRDIHQHPELGSREVRTAKIVADHLRSIGIETKTGVAHTGVVGVLKGGRPGPVILLRADMDGLPVEERNNLPFRSRARGCFAGDRVP